MKKISTSPIIIAAILLMLQACTAPDPTISVKNELGFDRAEIISISKEQLTQMGVEDLNSLQVQDQNGNTVVSQVTAAGELLLQAIVAANQETTFIVKNGASKKVLDPKISTFSRIVPERIDDYAWENDKVAFRTYGPEAQRLTDDGEPGGTLSSGIDCWLKRVDYPIINKWYAQAQDGKSYHKDHGEGLDNYHVGPSRGCGGIGIFENDTLYTSKNFQKWNTIDEGPLRTNFTLTYDPWEANGSMVSEEKYISLDLGSNMMKVGLTLKSSEDINQATVGIAIHDSLAVSNSDQNNGWFNLWSPHEDSELGTALVLNPTDIADYVDFRTSEQDKSHIFVHANTKAGKLTYYAGFTWMKSGQFSGQQEWEDYLDEFAQRLNSPLQVTFN